MSERSLTTFLARAAADEKRHRAFFENTREAEESLLASILARDARTAFGRAHGFSVLRSLSDWQAAVPIRTYEEYEPWIERAAQGDTAVLTEEPVAFFRRSSAASGASKKLPATRSSEAADLRLFRLTYALPFKLFPGLADRDDHVLDLMFDGQVEPPPLLPSGVPWGSMAAELSQRIAAPHAMLHGIPGSAAPWFDPGRILPGTDLTYFRLRLALEAPLRGLVATNPSGMANLARCLNDEGSRLVQEIHDGTVLGVKHPGVAANPARAREIDALRARLSRLKLRDVWPDLDYAVMWKSGSGAQYLPQLQEELGDRAKILPFHYGTSEGLGTAQLDDHPTGGFLAPVDVLFEFVPAQEELKPDSHTLRGSQLAEAGPGDYHLVHTAQNGLHRYAVGDVVHVIEVTGGVPRVEFRRRAGAIGSITGEKITEAHVIHAVTRACENLELTFTDFTCCPRQGDPPRYEFIVELDAATPGIPLRGLLGLGSELDRQLSASCTDYPGKRQAGHLEAPRVHLVPPGTFDRLREAPADPKNASIPPMKERPLQKDGSLLERLYGAGR